MEKELTHTHSHIFTHKQHSVVYSVVYSYMFANMWPQIVSDSNFPPSLPRGSVGFHIGSIA